MERLERVEKKLYFQDMLERAKGLEVDNSLRQIAEWIVENAEKGYVEHGLRDEMASLLDTMSGGEQSSLFNPLLAIAELLLDEAYADVFRYMVRHAAEYPYSSGYTRRPFRTKELRAHTGTLIVKINSLVCMQWLSFSTLDYLTKPDYFSNNDYRIPTDALPDLIAYEIDLGNEHVLNALKDIIYGDNNTALLSAPMIKGAFLSHNKDVYRMIGELLVAARLQEGLRQSIVERMDEGTLDAMIHMLQVIESHNLIRFSSVVRALDVWTGLALEAADTRVAKQCLELAAQALEDKELREAWLDSKNVNEIFMSLWAYAVHEEQELYDKIRHLMQRGETYQKIVAQYMLAQSQNKEVCFQIAHEWLGEKDPELRYWILYNYSFDYSQTWDQEDGKFTLKLKVPRIAVLEDKSVRRQQFGLFGQMFAELGQKELTMASKVFDWIHIRYSSDMIVSKMMYLTGYDMDHEWIAELIARKEALAPDRRGDLLVHFTGDPANRLQREFILASLGDKSLSNREKALTEAAKLELSGSELEAVAAILKLKTGSLRQSAIQLLLKQPAEKLTSVLELLLHSRNELQRMAALEMLTELKEEASFNEIYPLLKDQITQIEAPSDKEQLLIAKLEQSEAYNAANGFGLFDPKTGTAELTEVQKVPLSALLEGKKSFTLSLQRAQEFLTGLSELIHEHRHHEYEVEDYSGAKQTLLLGTNLTTLKWRYDLADADQPVLERYPLAEVWKAYLEKSGFSPVELLQLEFYKNADTLYDYYFGELSSWEQTYYKPLEGWRKEFLDNLYPMSMLKGVEEFYEELPYSSQAQSLVKAYLEDNDKQSLFSFVNPVLNLIIGAFPEENLEEENKLLELFVRFWISWERKATYDDVSFKASFLLHYKLYGMQQYESTNLSLIDFLRAYKLGFFTENDMFKELLARPYSNHYIRQMTHTNGRFAEENPEIIPFQEKALQRILEIELNRGDLSTEVTRLATSIQYIEGMAYFMDILAGLEKEAFVRGFIYSYGNDLTKKEMFSRLLRACHPKKEEDAALLKQLLKDKKISELRLLEAAMYAPQWVEIISQYLGWRGLRSAAWYFHAHINESFSAEKETIVAHYSPISPQDFTDGAFDIHWFKEAYQELGEKKFQMLYQCAKYISAGSNHRRSQLFADAVLGRLKLQEMKASVADKRNKDHLLSYSLIPLSEDAAGDVLERYTFIQQFLKESKTFGAQRRVSEAKTASIALDNLARNAGYADVIRLTWDMEGRKLDELLHYFEPMELEDLTAQLVIDEDGKSDIRLSRKGKELKSIPAAYKKHAYIESLRNTKTELADQYRRARAELERSMESGSVFTLQEISRLMQNPVLSPLVGALVFVARGLDRLDGLDGNDGNYVQGGSDENSGHTRHLGYFEGGVLLGIDGLKYTIAESDSLLIAHPLHLYQSGQWSQYQKDLFDRQIKQPFKQIFRELYLPNADELASGTLSRRYAGHQVQPRKTVSLLKNRFWTVSYEEGLQKVYYKENVIASIYALADWFSPSDVESPTLETVRFYDRNTYKNLAIDQVPSLIFSEVMRDVDLVVSTAHVGGVDPEASLTTIGMRTAIVRESLRLLKIDNVVLEGNHARIAGQLGEYSVHLGSGMVYKQAVGALAILPVHSQHRGKLFLPFMDEDPKTAEILSKIVLLAQDTKIKDPQILSQLRS
ncbi:DUF4132 domain-containing protein [Paenibacillus eucommiae]|uniref:Transcription termination factor NusB n=1 Tax=Paenibacillus eucommiae TaxID=1355755 RepID=A0ABS4J1K4_9BACL|nr:DUF5724 domain-containing protein [Paenibacillus eucommiae]MBP1993696.1 transcription termination factor NusB [Paenibacillus eucommiae]